MTNSIGVTVTAYRKAIGTRVSAHKRGWPKAAGKMFNSPGPMTAEEKAKLDQEKARRRQEEQAARQQRNLESMMRGKNTYFVKTRGEPEMVPFLSAPQGTVGASVLYSRRYYR